MTANKNYLSKLILLCAMYLFCCNKVSSFSTDIKSTIDSLLTIGLSVKKDYRKNPSRSFNYYHKAFTLSITINDSLRARKSLHEILSLFSIVDTHTEYWDQYLSFHEQYCTTTEDRYWNKFHQVRLTLQRDFREKNYKCYYSFNWDEIIRKVKDLEDTKLQIEFLSLYAVYLEVHDENDDHAIENYNNVLALIQTNNDSALHRYQFTIYGNIGNLYQKQRKFDLAIDHYNKALVEDSDIRVYSNMLNIYGWLSRCYEEKGEFDSSLHFMKLYNRTIINSQKVENDIAISDIEEKYQNEKLNNDLSQAELKQRQFYIISITLGCALSFALFGILGIRRINKLKQLTLQQEIKDNQQKAQISAINARLDGEEEERRRVASVLHDAIAGHLTAASFHLQTLQSAEDSTQLSDKAAKLIVEAAEQTRQLSHELYPPVLIKDGLKGAIQALCEKYSNSKINLTFTNYWSILELPQDLEAKIYFIIIELIQNILKHSEATEASITFNQSVNDELYIAVKDNGCGFDLEQNKNSLGLQTIISRVESLNGEIRYYTAPDQGTLIEFYIPTSAFG